MPLIKRSSKKDFDDESEMESGKPKSLAIAYNTQRIAKKKKMAYGGPADRQDGAVDPEPRKPDDFRPPEDQYMADRFAKGGEVDSHYDSIADAIMRKKKMADGGEVDINSNAEETPSTLSPFDDDNSDAVLKELYDDDQIGPQPEDSNEIGDEREDEESDKFDMVSAIRKKMKKG